MTIASLVTLIGVAFYLLTHDSYPRVIRVGEIMFAVGLVFVLIAAGGKALGL